MQQNTEKHPEYPHLFTRLAQQNDALLGHWFCNGNFVRF